MKQELIYLGSDNANLFFWITDESASFSFACDTQNAPTVTAVNETATESRRLVFGKSYTLPKGTWCLTLSPNVKPTRASVTVTWESGAYPFLLSGPGIWHARFLEESLHFPKDTTATLYVAVPPSEEPLTVTTWRVIEGNTRIFRPSGEEIDSFWLPHGQPKGYGMWFETDVETKGEYGYYRVESRHEGVEFRVSVWNGYAMFLEKPDREYTYSWFTPHCDSDMDYRVFILRNGHIDVAIDRLYSETHAVPYIKGDLRLRFMAGARYSTAEMPMPSGDKTEATVHFDELIDIPDGWVYGDCHVHSGYEDACCSPRIISKVARCNGLDFVFLTDHGGKNVVDGGLYTWKEEGRFSPLPGQECVNKRTHMNFLNVPFNIDYKGNDEGYWLRYARENNPEGNHYMPMLNHPDHSLDDTMANPYFRSWWVLSEHKEIPMVENISSHRTLFDMLNRGQIVYRNSTTDTHDGTKYAPGQSGCYVYTGGATDGNSIVDAMRQGRISCGKGGGAIFLTYTVDGELPGGIREKKESYEIDIELRMAAHDVKKVTLIRNGFALRNFETEDKRIQHFKTTVTFDELYGWSYNALWLAVIGYDDVSKHGTRPAYFEPKGIAYYANPTFFEGANEEF